MSEPQTREWLQRLAAALPEGTLAECRWFREQPTLTVAPAGLLEAMRVLRDQSGFRYLCDVTALDRFPETPRFEVVYHLWNHAQGRLLRVKVQASGDPPGVPSVVDLWRTADWHERECFDLFGVHFHGHPDLRRILTPDGWQGHPLRKDYPTMGPPEVQTWVPPREDAAAGGEAAGAGDGGTGVAR